MEVAIEGARLHLAVLGEGAPVLLVHGFPFSSAMWEPVGRRLAEGGHKVLIPDLRGFGKSKGAPVSDLGTFVTDLLSLLDVLWVNGALPWVGFSMGGYVAFEAWRRRPDRIESLALVDTRAGADDPAARDGRLATALRVEREGSGVVADAMLPKLFAAATPPSQRQAVHAAMTDAAPAAVAGALRAMAARPDSTPTLHKISVRTLVIVGAEDAITPPREAEVLVGGIPDARLRVVRDAGHLAPLEQPAAVADALLEFLANPVLRRR